MADVEALLCAHLAPLLGVPVSTHTPPTDYDPEHQQAFVRVWRTGGGMLSRVVDRPQMSVQAWAPTTVQAHDLAATARTALLAMPRASLGVHRVAVESFYYDPDPVTGAHRYSLLAFLTIHSRRTQ